jgi:hypothetical protein
MKTMTVIFVLALITIAFEIYSDAALTSADVSHASAPDPVTAAVAHALKHGYPRELESFGLDGAWSPDADCFGRSRSFYLPIITSL